MIGNDKKPSAKPVAETEIADKDERDIVVFYNNEFFHLPYKEWVKSRKLGAGEQTVLVPLVDNGTLIAHVDHATPKFGTWTNLLNLDGILETCRKRQR